MNTSERRINQEVVEIFENVKLKYAVEEVTKSYRYQLIKLADAAEYLGPKGFKDMVDALEPFLEKIEQGRVKDGKTPGNDYIVINQDEPYINDIVAILEANGHWEGKPSGVMKFYEVHDPYYALIMARDVEEAMKIYVETVADDDGTLIDEIEEITRDYALLRISRAPGEDGKPIDYKELLDSFSSKEPQLFIVDGSLI